MCRIPCPRVLQRREGVALCREWTSAEAVGVGRGAVTRAPPRLAVPVLLWLCALFLL